VWINSFIFLKKVKKYFLALVGITWVEGTSVIKKESEKGGSVIYFWNHFSSVSIKKSIKKSMQKTMSKKHENNCKRLPKLSRNRCQNASKINARTGIEKNQGNHQNSCFSEE
jgi:hypothetical protein